MHLSEEQRVKEKERKAGKNFKRGLGKMGRKVRRGSGESWDGGVREKGWRGEGRGEGQGGREGGGRRERGLVVAVKETP